LHEVERVVLIPIARRSAEEYPGVRACMREDSTMRLSAIGLILTFAIFVALLAPDAQQPGKAYQIGVLATTYWPPFDSFRVGLRELGYLVAGAKFATAEIFGI